jgi:hypothetical protein
MVNSGRVNKKIKELGLDKKEIFDYSCFVKISGNSSVVERNLAKVDVAGSNPVSRSMMAA